MLGSIVKSLRISHRNLWHNDTFGAFQVKIFHFHPKQYDPCCFAVRVSLNAKFIAQPVPPGSGNRIGHPEHAAPRERIPRHISEHIKTGQITVDCFGQNPPEGVRPCNPMARIPMREIGVLANPAHLWHAGEGQRKIAAPGVVNFDIGKLGKHFIHVAFQLGFNVAWRWSDDYIWEASFADGAVPAYHTIDAQINLKVPSLKSTFKAGATNLLGDEYFTAFGTGHIGSQYYVSWTINNL